MTLNKSLSLSNLSSSWIKWKGLNNWFLRSSLYKHSMILALPASTTLNLALHDTLCLIYAFSPFHVWSTWEFTKVSSICYLFDLHTHMKERATLKPQMILPRHLAVSNLSVLMTAMLISVALTSFLKSRCLQWPAPLLGEHPVGFSHLTCSAFSFWFSFPNQHPVRLLYPSK